ncbi:MAG: LacI family DNA-binding transcriptional regulator [Verrucomicrobia bacterium]|nr:LacI family DNA-binding transcriptional regulator [Verrucomicrobiota bacterium]MCH8512534.1 LacI family DNA-binding transcriptional regulator [Kiritimatiellia bacterium]
MTSLNPPRETDNAMKAHNLKTIADIAGVTRTTVSLSLRNNPRISEATRSRIQRIARDLDYRPNAEVSRVMGSLRKTNTAPSVLAWIVDEAPDESLFDAFCQSAERLRYQLELFRIDAPRLSAKRLENILFTRNIQGVIFTTPRHPGFAENMDLSRFSACAFGTQSQILHQVAWVEKDKCWCTREAIMLLDQMIRFHETGIPGTAKRISPCTR